MRRQLANFGLASVLLLWGVLLGLLLARATFERYGPEPEPIVVYFPCAPGGET